ncbi:hypothetical protein L873DRAFT_1832630 [Choiromyces venosus 120613-1]|uniref:Protein BTN n=1 Tax=Choiromyces venosus 120613-1 TaxID=1336337 RepID=A0A3N4K7N7_9PEZI|nr:hypothetical protein L873DRAFT_1832630 [Choiromyces venosus 120613-1]
MPRTDSPPQSSVGEKGPSRGILSRNVNSRSRIFQLQQQKQQQQGPIKSPVMYDTFRPKRRKMDIPAANRGSKSKERDGRGSGGFLPAQALLFLSFWLFGTLVTMQFGYFVVRAANDLVGNSAPPGLILFAYPAFGSYPFFRPVYQVPRFLFLVLLIYISPCPDHSRIHTPGGISRPGTPGPGTATKVSQEINYAARLTVCATASFLGLQLLPWSDSVGIRMLGISLASLSSNLATRYPAMISQSFGGYAAGSGAAGLIGSFAYTVLTTSFAVSPKVLSGIGVVPTVMLFAYFFLLPSFVEVERAAAASGARDVPPIEESTGGNLIGDLKLGDKLRLVRPMIWGDMAPLAIMMFLENNPPRFLPIPYTTYQFAIFGRTPITLFRLPGGNSRSSYAYWSLCAVEGTCFISLLAQGRSMVAPVLTKLASENPDNNILFSPTCNTYWRVSKPLPSTVWTALDSARIKRARRNFETQEEGVPAPLLNATPGGSRRRSQEGEAAVREFLISTIALPDTLAIMFASVVQGGMELCRAER